MCLSIIEDEPGPVLVLLIHLKSGVLRKDGNCLISLKNRRLFLNLSITNGSKVSSFQITRQNALSGKKPDLLLIRYPIENIPGRTHVFQTSPKSGAWVKRIDTRQTN